MLRKLQVWIVALLTLTLLVSAGVFAFPAQAQVKTWQKATPPIKTRWYDEVSPTNAHPEYPRPQMVRADWLNLNGLWEFAKATDGQAPPFGQTLGEQILVPYPVESALSGLMRHEARMWYRRVFDVPAEWRGKRLLLHFGAVDWQTTAYVNGKQVGVHTGGYDGFSFDITNYLNAASGQELLVNVYDPTDTGGQPRGKQVTKPGGIWYTSTSGIWQTVWLEPVGQTSIARLQMTPDIDAGVLRLTAFTDGSTDGYTVTAVAFEDRTPLKPVHGTAGTELQLPIPKAHLWSPDDPFLYDLQVSLSDGKNAGKNTVDQVSSYFGMRKIAVGKVAGVNRILLNNQFLFEIGPLDQGFWPEGIYTAPTDNALRYDLQFEKQLGWNTVRKHIKVEPDRWYYWADRLGLLVWQDMPSPDANNKIPLPPGDFEAELRAMIEGRRNHPSIVLWVLFNEGWGQDQFGPLGTGRYTKFIRDLDPSRLVTDATGWNDYGVGNISDYHTYVGPTSPIPDAKRAAVQGEFGGLGLHTRGHEWGGGSFAYEWHSSPADVTQRYTGLIDTASALMIDSGLSAAIYTEVTDIEQELNGFITYDRAVIKVNVAAIHDANQQLIERSKELNTPRTFF